MFGHMERMDDEGLTRRVKWLEEAGKLTKRGMDGVKKYKSI